MKKIFRNIVLWLLTAMAKFRLNRFKGKVIAVGGSVGKTSTKEAIFSVLNTRYKVKRSEKSMNSEFGLVLTILDIESGYSSAVKWSWLLMKAFAHCLTKEYNEILLLEFGTDQPGDMDFLASIVRPDIAVITNITPVHMDDSQFKSIEEIFNEERKLVDYLNEKGIAVLNFDNSYTMKLAKEVRRKKKVIGFGQDRESDFRVALVKTSLEGTTFDLFHGPDRVQVHVDILGRYQVYVLLPAIVCGVSLGMSLEETLIALKRYSLPPGRMSLIPGKNESLLLDSSYNSSPDALVEALVVLDEVSSEEKRRIAVIGDMNELGTKSQEMHEHIGEIVPQYADILITVGVKAKFVAAKAEESGMSKDAIFKFKTVKGAIDYFENEVKPNDIILVKGSQNNIRLERFVKAFMLNPDDAEKLLPRQEKFWLTQP